MGLKKGYPSNPHHGFRKEVSLFHFRVLGYFVDFKDHGCVCVWGGVGGGGRDLVQLWKGNAYANEVEGGASCCF